MRKTLPFQILVSTLVVTACANLAFSAPAQNARESEVLIQEGIELRRLSDDQAALEKFEAAVKLAETPRALAQLGLCELAVGRFSSAVEHLTIAMRARKDKWIVTNKESLRDSLEQAKARVGRIEVVTDPEGARIFLNGEHVGTSPLSAPLVANEGTVDVQVKLEGYATQMRSLAIKGGQYQRLALTLERPRAQEPIASPVPTPRAPVDVEAQEPALGSDIRRPWIAPTKWAALGAAGLGVAVGTYAWVQHQNAVEAFDKAGCQVNRRGDPGFVSGDNTFMPTDDCTDRHDKIGNAGTLRLVGYIAGGAFLAGYLVLALLDRGSVPQASTASGVAITCGAGLASLSCAGRF